MDHGAVPHDNIVSNDDVRDACMDDAIVLDTAIAPDLNSESIRSQNRAGPNIGISPYFYISDQIGILADKSSGINLWLFLPKTLNHSSNLLLFN
jgi:hypothetical protein